MAGPSAEEFDGGAGTRPEILPVFAQMRGRRFRLSIDFFTAQRAVGVLDSFQPCLFSAATVHCKTLIAGQALLCLPGAIIAAARGPRTILSRIALPV